MWIVNHVCDKAGEDYMMCVCVCKSVRGREKELLWTMRQDGGWLTILKSIIKYKNTHNEVYIQLMYKGAHV